MAHGMQMSGPNQITSSGVSTGMSQMPGQPMTTQQIPGQPMTGQQMPGQPMTGQQIPGQQIPMTQPQKMIPSPQVQQQQQQQQQQQISAHPDNSSIEKMKALVPHLKKALANVMRLAGESLRRDDIFSPSSSSAAPSVEKALEEFFAICDQLEMHLGIALEGFNQVIQHKKYLNPECIRHSFPPGQNADVVQHYNAFSTVIRSQVALASSLHDALINCADQISTVPSSSSSTPAGVPSSSSSAAASQSHRFAQNGQPQPGTQFSAGGLAVPPATSANNAPTTNATPTTATNTTS